ncbi:hypothetical protein EVAR_79422_1 [Eumeta japonica]|uniref:OAR domain-containing protein n=1 Tax=Eumeta variegata TaxID=151549 RepID=A0A4C1VFT2_EUMVA|nr:hypothetical protein EVAR_79422_1 [Eumeta japonica]
MTDNLREEHHSVATTEDNISALRHNQVHMSQVHKILHEHLAYASAAAAAAAALCPPYGLAALAARCRSSSIADLRLKARRHAAALAAARAPSPPLPPAQPAQALNPTSADT